MISLDIETTGLTPGVHGLVSIGAVHLETGDEYYIECCITPKTAVSEKALEINGFTMEELYDESKPTEVEAVEEFIKWAKKYDDGKPILIGQNLPSFDVPFLKKLSTYSPIYHGPDWPFGHRYIDLHSQVELVTGKSIGAAEACDMFNVKKEPSVHDALEGALQNARLYEKLTSLIRDHGVDKVDYWFMTSTGIKFFPNYPTSDMIDIEDIAQGLSNVCRFAGQVNNFYSVAQHTIGVTWIVQQRGGTQEEVFQAFLHDAAEAYICDLPSPLKKTLPSYQQIEKNIMKAIGKKFDIDLMDLAPIVKEVDEQMLFHEANNLFDEGIVDWAGEVDMDVKETFMNKDGTISCMPPRLIKSLFLREFQSIKEKVKLEV